MWPQKANIEVKLKILIIVKEVLRKKTNAYTIRIRKKKFVQAENNFRILCILNKKL